MNNKRKIIQLVSFPSVYNDNLQKELKQNEVFNKQFSLFSYNVNDLLSEFDTCGRYLNMNKIEKLFFWIRFNRFLKNKFIVFQKDCIINIQFISFFYVCLIPFFRFISNDVILSFWGSDLLRQSKSKLFLMRALVSIAKYVTFETEEMKKEFQKRMGHNYDKKIKIVKFGISIFDDIDSVCEKDIVDFANKNHIDNTKKCIMIGYNRNKSHQHDRIIKAIDKDTTYRKDIFIIIPWMYGPNDNSYKSEINRLLINKYHYAFLEEPLSNKEIAVLRKITDVLIQVQTTDSLSSTMLETLYAQKEVITGSWLPYNELYKLGIKMTKVNDVDEVNEALEKCLQEPLDNSSLEKNRKIIKNLSSWSVCIFNWIHLYQLCLTDNDC